MLSGQSARVHPRAVGHARKRLGRPSSKEIDSPPLCRAFAAAKSCAVCRAPANSARRQYRACHGGGNSATRALIIAETESCSAPANRSIRHATWRNRPNPESGVLRAVRQANISRLGFACCHSISSHFSAQLAQVGIAMQRPHALPGGDAVTASSRCLRAR